MNQRKHGLEGKNLHIRASSANTPKEQNVLKKQKNDITQQAMNNGCKSTCVQAIWSAILKEHIEMLDSHIDFLNLSMKRVKSEKPDKPSDLESEESISWKVIYRAMDAAMEVLTRSREAAVGILPVYAPLDDKDLDQKGNKFQRLEIVSRWDKDIASSRAADTISELDSSSIGYNNTESSTGLRTMPNPPHIGINKLCLSRKSKKPKNKTARNIRIGGEQWDNERTKADVDRLTSTPSKPQFHDLKEVNHTGSNKKKKRVQLVEAEESCELTKATGSQKGTTATLAMTESIDIDVDFAAIEIKLQEEIAAGERAAKEAQRSTTYTTSLSPASSNPRKKKRRRCSSDDLSRVRQVEKKLRREELEKLFREKKRKVDEFEFDKEVNDCKRKKIRRIPKGKVFQND